MISESVLLFLDLTPKIYEWVQATRRRYSPNKLQQKKHVENNKGKGSYYSSRGVLAWMLRRHVSQASSLQLQEPPGPSEVFARTHESSSSLPQADLKKKVSRKK